MLNTRDFGVLLVFGFGCGSTVTIEDLGDPALAEPTCSEEATDPVQVGPIASASVIGDTLHVEGQIDGRDAYAVLDVSRSPARLVELREDLRGGAAWVHAVGDHYARVRGHMLDIVDAGDPEHVRLVSSTDLGEPQPAGWAGALGAHEGELHTCVHSRELADDFLSRIDVSDPTHPGAPRSEHNYACDTFGELSQADGALWVTWSESNVALFDLSDSNEGDIVSHGWVPDGAHNYGGITAVQTDGRVVATTLENDAYAFLYYRDVTRPIVYSSFGAGDKQLLEVVDGNALVVVPHGEQEVAVEAFDIADAPEDEQPARKTTMEVVLSGAVGSLGDYVAVAHDDERIFVADAATIFVVPLGGTQPVEPLVVTRGAADPCP